MSTGRKSKDINQKCDINSLNQDSSPSLYERSAFTLDLVNSWINAADTKVSVFCGVFSIVTAVIVFIAEDLLKGLNAGGVVNETLHDHFIYAAISAFILFLLSLFFQLWAIVPNLFTGKKKRDLPQHFSIFYNDICKFKDEDEYAAKAQKSTIKQYTDEILKETYYNSKICANKMKRFKTGCILAGISIFLIFISICLYYLSYTICPVG